MSAFPLVPPLPTRPLQATPCIWPKKADRFGSAPCRAAQRAEAQETAVNRPRRLRCHSKSGQVWVRILPRFGSRRRPRNLGKLVTPLQRAQKSGQVWVRTLPMSGFEKTPENAGDCERYVRSSGFSHRRANWFWELEQEVTEETEIYWLIQEVISFSVLSVASCSKFFLFFVAVPDG